MKIAVTAVSGQLGAEIARATARVVGNDRVVGLARTPTKARPENLEIRPGDYAQPKELETSLQGVEALLLVSGSGDPKPRVGLHRNVVGAAKNAGVKKIVYTSVQGAEQGTAFSPIIQSNRQTEEDIRNSGLDWVIGRNGIYIEPDLESRTAYVEAGEIANCAGDGKCAYTTRPELAHAYARLLTEDRHHGQTYNLHGELLSQAQLVDHINRGFGTELRYRGLTVEEYRAERIQALGEFMGTVITGIYEGIRNGALENESHFAAAAGREHQSWTDFFAAQSKLPG